MCDSQSFVQLTDFSVNTKDSVSIQDIFNIVSRLGPR